MDLRALIIGRINSHGHGPFWVLDVYHHLVCSQGVSPDDASKALNAFVDEIIERKRQHGRAPVGI